VVAANLTAVRRGYTEVREIDVGRIARPKASRTG
jgi:hypothetical protein